MSVEVADYETPLAARLLSFGARRQQMNSAFSFTIIMGWLTMLLFCPVSTLV